MKKIKILLKSETFFFILLSTIIIVAGTIATPYRSLIAKPNTVYDGTEFYSDDYSVYASYILEGQKGRWTVIDKHTTEPHQGTLIHIEYLLWGKLMGIFGFDNLQAYQLGRIFFGACVLFALYTFLRMILPKKTRLLAFFLILFSAGFPQISKSQEGNWIVRNQMEWFTEIDIFQRFTVLMHYLLGNLFFLLSLIFLLKTFWQEKIQLPMRIGKKNTIPPLFFAIISGVLLSLTHPSNLILAYGTISIYLLFSMVTSLIWSKININVIKKKFQNEILPSFIYFCITVPVLLYFRSLFSLPVWKDIAAWDVTQYSISLNEFAKTIGTTSFLAPIGFFVILFSRYSISENLKIYQKRQVGMFLLSWIFSFFILFYYSYPFLNISQVRFMQNFIFIPFGILAAIGIVFVSRVFSSLASHISNLSYLSNLGNLFTTVILLLIVTISLPAYYRSMELKLTIFSPTDPLMFPDKIWVEAIKWLGKNSHPEDPVISAWHAGHAIPYLGGNTVYVGHLWSTIDRQKKEQKLYKFLQNQMDIVEMKEFLKETTAKYLFFGYQEKFSGLKPDNSPFFIKVFDNSSVKIYKFQP